MHFSRLAPLAVLACSHLVLSQGVNPSAAANQTGVAAAVNGIVEPSNTTASNTVSNGVSETVSDASNTTSTEDSPSASTGSTDPSSVSGSSDPTSGNFTSIDSIDSSSAGGSGSAVADLPSSNSTTSGSNNSYGSAPSSAPSPSSSKSSQHDNHDHHDHDHDGNDKSDHPHHHHHHPHINGTFADFDKHKNRTGEHTHFEHPIEDKVDIVKVDKRLEIDGKPINFGPGPVVTPETTIPSSFWHHPGGIPEVEAEGDFGMVIAREAKAIEDRNAGQYNETEAVESEAFNATGKGHPHHEHAGKHHNGTEHHDHHGKFEGEKQGARYNETELPEHHKFNETGNGYPTNDKEPVLGAS